MNEQSSLNLTLGEPPAGLKRREGRGPRGLLWLLALMQAATLVGLAVVLSRSSGPAAASNAAGQATPSGELRATAKQLEDKGLDAEAAGVWQSYLQAAPDGPDRAEILYRIGKLRMQAEQYGAAVAALFRAEQAAEGNKDLTTKVGPLVVQCLSRLGRYGEVGRELARRVEVGGEKDGRGKAKVVATITGQSLTEADLDRLAERRVDGMLAMQGAAGDEHRRQAILQQLSTPAARRQLLQELLQTELFCRRARELKLDQDDEFRHVRDQAEQSLLAERFLAKELGKIEPTEVDLESYYKANTSRYTEKKTGRTPPLEEISTQVRADYMARKQQEAGEKLSGDLMTRYQVRIMPLESPAKEAAPPAKVEKLSK
jgi:tetratricopeptide (TPR) repeat protein